MKRKHQYVFLVKINNGLWKVYT